MISIVRENLMAQPGYAPYCGNDRCTKGMPRTHFLRDQFRCSCGWCSDFDAAFIAEYKKKWNIA